MVYVASYYSYTKNIEVKIPEDYKELKYYFKVSDTSSYNAYITIYRESKEEEKALFEEIENRKNEKLSALKVLEDMIKEITKRHEKLVEKYICELKNVSKYAEDIAAFAAELILFDCIDEEETIKEIIHYSGEVVSEDSEENNIAFREILQNNPLKTLLIIAYLKNIEIYGVDNYRRRWNEKEQCYEIFHRRIRSKEQMYKILEKTGYEISDEEQSMLNGTHELFLKKNEI